ncbi:MAG TPA: hypothetical protein VN688_07895, partial [Gemmataceae bacterium]|nr:hypothetical protein [Gemmataceae bacterium]
ADVMISGCQGLFSFASPIFFLLFTRSLADYVDRRDLGQSAMTVLWLWVAAVGTYVFGLVMMVIGVVAMAGAGRAGRAGIAGVGCFGLIVLLIAFVIAIIALIRYIILLRRAAGLVLPAARFDRDVVFTKRRGSLHSRLVRLHLLLRKADAVAVVADQSLHGRRATLPGHP